MLPSSNLPWLNSRQAHNMTHSSSIERGRQLCAWASLPQPSSYLQRSTGCLATLDKASLPWERLDSSIWTNLRVNSAPLWLQGHNATNQPSVAGSRLYFGTVSFLISCNSVAWSGVLLFFFRYTSFLKSVSVICWTPETENRMFLWFILDSEPFITAKHVRVTAAVHFRWKLWGEIYFF